MKLAFFTVPVMDSRGATEELNLIFSQKVTKTAKFSGVGATRCGVPELSPVGLHFERKAEKDAGLAVRDP
jgi:hypothetical protein